MSSWILAVSRTGSASGCNLVVFRPDKVALVPYRCVSSTLSVLMRTVPGGISRAVDFAPFAASMSMKSANLSSRRTLKLRIGWRNGPGSATPKPGSLSISMA